MPKYLGNIITRSATTPTTTAAKGIWTPEEQAYYKKAGTWPTTSPGIPTSGLVLNLDAADTGSYPGTGTTWYDLSGGGRNFTINSSYVTWNSAGYFSVNSVAAAATAFTGPGSDTFTFASNNDHTIIAWVKFSSRSNSNFFNWQATSASGDNRAIFTHFPYGSGSPDFYYDVSGCCTSTYRISSSTAADNFDNSVRMAAWRHRSATTPRRQFFDNTVSMVDSSTSSSATVTWNLTTAVGLCNTWNGNLYVFLAYNRALSDAELTQVFDAQKTRFGY